MVIQERIEKYKRVGRYVEVAKTGDEDLGPLQLLPGTWRNSGSFARRGWNMIALPFEGSGPPLDYRLLVNQFTEELKFTLVDKAVPNRGINRDTNTNTDQFVVTLDFEQMIKQVMAEDEPVSGLAGAPDLAIHHEPGLWLHQTNERTANIDIARLSTIPHGDSLLALGTSDRFDGAPSVPEVNGLPIGVGNDLEGNPYLGPYKFFNDNPFKGVESAGFPGFNPVSPQALLTLGMPQNVVSTTVLHVDTEIMDDQFKQAGIRNIPFVVRQANAAVMQSTFWIMELDEMGADGRPKLVLAYLQNVGLDFFPRRDGVDGLIRWPHVSINMMEKVQEADAQKAEMPAV